MRMAGAGILVCNKILGRDKRDSHTNHFVLCIMISQINFLWCLHLFCFLWKKICWLCGIHCKHRCLERAAGVQPPQLILVPMGMGGGREGNLPHQKNIFYMTLKVMSKALKHVIMPWHVSSTWPIYDLNVVFKCRYWAFPFMLVFVLLCDLLMVKKGICTCIRIHWYLTSLIREDLLY